MSDPTYIYAGEEDTSPKPQVGAVIQFAPNASREKCQQFLDSLYERGILERPATAHEFDGRYGGPVWYIP